MTTATYLSLYDRRIKLVRDTLTQHAKLSDKDAAQALAEHVLDALDHIPEKMH